MRTKNPPEPVIVTDPIELAFLRIVQSMSPEEQTDFAEGAAAGPEPAGARAASGVAAAFPEWYTPDPQERAAGMMRLLDLPMRCINVSPMPDAFAEARRWCATPAA